MAEFPSWQQGLRRSYPPLRGVNRADAVIVGGGLCGVMTALMLREQGLSVTLLEARQLGQGATFGCGGILTCQAGPVLGRIGSESAAMAYAQLLRESVTGLSHMLQRLEISCRMTECSVYTYAETEADLPALEALIRLEGKLGLNLFAAQDAGGCPFPVSLSAVMPRQYLLDPLPCLLALAERAEALGVRICEQSPVADCSGSRVRTAEGFVEARHVILCTGVPLQCRQLPVLGLLEPRLMEARVLASPAPLHTVQLSVHGDEMTLRPLPGGMLMLLDRGALGTRQTESTRIVRGRTLSALLPESQTRDVILRREIFSRDGLPLIGPIRPENRRLLMAGGFSGLGLAGSFLAARVLTGMLLDQPLPETGLFLPFRAQQSPLHTLRTSAASLRGISRAAAHPRLPRCPHMGCPLRYNPGSRRWECPCHGSTFDVLGQVESAPAARNADLSPRDRR